MKNKNNTHNSIFEARPKHKLSSLLKNWDVKVMSYVMVVVCMIAVIAATVAWFHYEKVALVTNMSALTADCGSLRVEVKQGQDGGLISFAEVAEGNENAVFADLDMPVFENVSEGKTAPGVYGSVTIRLTALSDTINNYRIAPHTIFNYVESLPVMLSDGLTADVQTDPQVIALQALAKGHVLYFGARAARTDEGSSIVIDGQNKLVDSYTHNSRYVFYNPISEEQPLEGTLEWDAVNNEGIPAEVTIYWYWPYEYANLSDDIQNTIKLPDDPADMRDAVYDEERLKFFDKAKLLELLDDAAAWDETQLYDYADTRIGIYVKKIKIRLGVEGYHANND